MAVTNNDRIFTCTLQSCGETNPLSRLQGAITINAQFLDVDQIRQNIYDISAQVGEAVGDFKSWLNTRESEFETKFLLREINSNLTLFNRLNIAIARLRQHNNTLNQWYTNFQNLVSLAIDYLSTYSEATALIKSFTLNPTIGGLQPSPVVLAKQHLSKSKSIQRQMNVALMAEARLKTVMIQLQTQVESFYRGTIKVNDRVLDLKEVGKLIGDLMGSESPLERVQANLSNVINSSQTTFDIKSSDVSAVKPPGDSFLQRLTKSVNANRDVTADIVKKLRILNNTVLYTDNTKATIEAFLELAEKEVLETDPRYAEVRSLITSIRGNDPATVVRKYRASVRDTDRIYLLLTRLRVIMQNLDPNDQIYREIFQSIYDEMYREAKLQLGGSSSSSDEPMMTEPSPARSDLSTATTTTTTSASTIL